MGRAGIEPATLGLKVAVGALAASRVVSGKPLPERDSATGAGAGSRPVSAGLVPTLFPPRGERDALRGARCALRPGAALDPRTRDRGGTQAAAAPIESAAKVESVSAAQVPAPRSARLASNRACVESNLARKGLWRSGPAPSAGGGELVRLLDATDQLGLVQRIDAGPPLGALAFDVAVWACSRWREQGDRHERHVPLTLEGLAADLGWRKGGGAAAELARTLDALRSATFRARVYNARLSETRIDTFGLLDRWQRGERHRDGRPARPGFLVLGDWLHEQLVRGHLTFVDWSQLRALQGGTARRLLVYLDAERFAGSAWRRTIDAALLTTLGIVAARPIISGPPCAGRRRR